MIKRSTSDLVSVAAAALLGVSGLLSSPVHAGLVHGAAVFVQRMGEEAVSSGGPGQNSAGLGLSDWRGSSAHAAASLRQGALHAYASTQPVVQPDCDPRANYTCNWHIGSTATVWDVLTFQRGELADLTDVDWRVDITGFLKEGWRSPVGLFGYYVGFDPHGWDSTRLISVRPGAHFAGSFELPDDPDETVEVYVKMILSAQAYNGSTADFSHTAKFGLELPQGVSFTSRSGVFLADVLPPPTRPQVVPEPSQLGPLGIGLAVMGLLRRRRSRAGQKT